MKFEIEFPDEALTAIVEGSIRAGFAYQSNNSYHTGSLAEKVVSLSREQAVAVLNQLDLSLWVKAAVEKYAPGIVEDVVKKVLTEQVRKVAKDLKDRGEWV